MTEFRRWAEDYFGENVSYGDAFLDCWNAAVEASAEQCDMMALVVIDANNEWTILGAVEECADSIRDLAEIAPPR